MALRPRRGSKVGLAEATSDDGTTREGASLNLDTIGAAGLIVDTVADLTTSDVAATFTPQVSNDGTTWYNLKEPQAPAQVAVATGTGSQVITRTALKIGKEVKAFQYFRCNAVLAGASTAAADKTTVTYRWADGVGI